MKTLIVVPAVSAYPPCIFCGAPGKTSEDAWPKWLLRRLKKQLGQDGTIDAEYDHRPLRSRSSIRIPGFCEKHCNNGWMRRLENETIPIMSPLLLGKSQELKSTAQLTLATWMNVRAVVFDCLRPPRFFDGRETSRLMNHGTPADSTFGVWLGRSTEPLAFTDGKKLTRREPDGRLIHEGYVLTMFFGFVALQVLTIRKPQSRPIATITVHHVSGPWNDLLIPIWPLTLSPVHWPPKLAFNPSAGGLGFLANRFNTSGNREPSTVT